MWARRCGLTSTSYEFEYQYHHGTMVNGTRSQTRPGTRASSRCTLGAAAHRAIVRDGGRRECLDGADEEDDELSAH